MGNVTVSAAGIQGPPGNTVRNGHGAPAASLGVDGDWYVDNTTPTALLIYGPKAGGVWGGGVPFGGTGGALLAANNLSDVGSTPTARTNLGLGSAATQSSSAFDASGAASTAQAAAIADAATKYLRLQPWVFDVTNASYGAKGDGQLVIDGAMASGSAVLTSSSAPFASTDVGKAIQVKGAGPAGVSTLVTTIASFQSATQVTLAAANASGSAVSGATVLWASDDTTAIQAAINAAVAYAQAHGGAATVFFPAPAGRFYGVAGALHQGGSTKGNAQLTVPVVATTGNKLVLTFLGCGDGSATQHWQEVPPQMSGSTLVSFGVFASAGAQTASINAAGNAALLGGPSQPGGFGISPGVFSNVHVVLRDLALRTSYSVSGLGYSAADFSGIAAATVERVGYGTLGTVANSDFQNPSSFGAGLVPGLLMPASGNNDLSVINQVTCHGGYTYGAFVTEHTDVYALRILYSWAGFCPVGAYYSSVGSTHAIRGFVSVEACYYHLYIVGPGSGGVGPFLHLLLDVEGGVKFSDNDSGTASAAARGQVVLTGEVTFPIALDYAVGFDLVNDQLTFPTAAVSTSYAVQPWDEVIEASGTITVTLPSAATRTKRVVVVNTGTGTVTIQAAGGQLISGSASKTLTTQWSHAEYTPAASGSSWNQIA